MQSVLENSVCSTFEIDDRRLTTPVGRAMAALPLPPAMARAVVAGGAAGCGAEMITLAALLSVASLWVGSTDRRRALQDAKLKCAPGSTLTTPCIVAVPLVGHPSPN